MPYELYPSHSLFVGIAGRLYCDGARYDSPQSLIEAILLPCCGGPMLVRIARKFPARVRVYLTCLQQDVAQQMIDSASRERDYILDNAPTPTSIAEMLMQCQSFD